MRLLGATALCAYLLLFPADAAQAAWGAFTLWAQKVCPALFPFFAMLPALTGADARRAYARVLGKLMRAWFRLPGEAAAAVAVGFVAGSPAGALAVRRAYLAGAIDNRHLFCASVLASGCGPVFLMSTVGAGMFASTRAGWVLIGSQVLALCLTGALIARLPAARLLSQEKALTRGKEAVLREKDSPSAIRDAALGLLGVGGWMALFAVIAAPFPRAFGLIAELVTGSKLAADIGSLPLAAGVCGFGGLCVLCQNLSALKGLGVRAYTLLGAKALCGGLCALICFAMEEILSDLPDAAAYMRATPARTMYIAAALAVALALIVTIISYCAKIRVLDKREKSDMV